jgi:hypothetical protein
MLTETLLDKSPLWLLYAATVLLLLGGAEAGFRLGIGHRARRPDGDKAPTNAIMGSLLGLLAFLLAFTFGMSSARFDARRQLVLDEASAILRAYQRAQLLPEPQRAEVARLLQEYLALRMRLPGMKSKTEIESAVARSEGIQQALWRQAQTLAERPNLVLSMFLQSLAELTDLQMKRVRAGFWNRIPPTIEVMLYTIAFLGLMALGFNTGLTGVRTLAPAVVLVLAFSSIIALIVDLERPRQTLFSVSQEPMADVARRIQAAPTPEPPPATSPAP